ncbi:TPA: hypothetical protein ACIN0K_000772 [Streptococcus agalactiae]
MAKRVTQKKLNKDALEAFSTLLSHFDELLDILNETHQKKMGHPIPLVLQIALKQYFEEIYARLSVLLRSDSLTLDEANELLDISIKLKYLSTDKEKEKLEKLFIISKI